MNKINGVSTIICCYNGAQKIEKTIEHLFRQKTKNINCEIIFVDNNSSDETVNIVSQLFEINGPKYRIKTKILSEPKPGRNFALETGLKNASFEYIIICDDDNRFYEDYILNAYHILEDKSEVGIAGGICLPEFESKPPFWMDKFYGGYACTTPNQISGYVNNVFGAGMIFRKSVFEEIKSKGFESLLICKRDAIFSNGDDTEYCKLFQLKNYKIWFDNRLKLTHFIPNNKLTWEYCKKLFASFQHAEVLLELYSFAQTEKFKKGLPTFYWLKKYLYYLLLPFKYYFKYRQELQKEGSSSSISFLAWKLKRNEYLLLNFKLNQHYKNILSLKNRLK